MELKTLKESCDCEQGAFTLLSYLSGEPNKFEELSKIIFSMPLSESLISGFAKFIEIRPEFSQIIYFPKNMISILTQ